MGGSDYALVSGSPTPYSTMDYNAYRRNEADRLISWKNHEGQVGRHQSIAEFFEATGLEEHGMLVDYDIFASAGPPERGITCNPAEYDLRLRAGAKVIDAGIALPQVTDGFVGKAPDLGCYELGQELPHYGPRF
ncbi:MAG: hypothetical protein ACYTDV_09795 [Planctomycetota bacterium]|jgi:hypothetical protein